MKKPPNKARTGRWGASRARFSSIFLASSLYYSQAESAPTPAPVSRGEYAGLTQTIRRNPE